MTPVWILKMEVDVEKNQSRQAVQQPAILYNKRVGPEVSERPEDYTLVFTRLKIQAHPGFFEDMDGD
jgi:hypothetical protein